MQEVIEALNEAQQEAVQHIDGPLLILAGAGSGKTKTLTTRLAYLISVIGINPKNTLTLTFTNKASREMRQRALALINIETSYMPLLCTFHKFGLIFLKFHIGRLGRANNFVIIDSDDRRKILKKIAKEHKIDLSIPFISSEIAKYKNNLLSADEIMEKAELIDYKKIAIIYKDYEKEIVENNLVDFDDLLMLTYKILNENDSLRRETSRRYQYIMVDEYQDTNELQFRLLELLASEHNNLCVVGDDDQSIYGWRGANIQNILEFSSYFKGTKVVKLETNYRSTTPILASANRLIENNTQRVGKRLTSFRGDGQKVKICHSLNESLEAKHIAKEIKELLNRGVSSDEIAVLYRINALSRSLEEGFTKENLSFKLIGGIGFYDRAEIKDIISYFRLFLNPNDDFSLERIINKPKRGLGKVSIDKLKKVAFERGSSIFSIIEEMNVTQLNTIVSKRASNSLKEFATNVNFLKKELENSIHLFLEEFEKRISIEDSYSKMADEMERILNIDEFKAYFRESISKNSNITLESFLNEVSLKSEHDDYRVEDTISIMSIHASKGLEFEHLYVIGLEEGFFPLLGDGINLEEERRLGYVAITRAKSDLTLCYTNSRFYNGTRRDMDRSRFLGEAGLIDDKTFKRNVSKGYKKGDLVKHKKFGIGRVQSVTKSGKNYKLKINFGGSKRDIMSSFVKIV